MALSIWSNETGQGWVLPGAGVIFSFDTGVIPDLSNEQLEPAFVNATGRRDGTLHAAPDPAVEVLSPGPANEQRDREITLKLYSRRGVREYWIVDRQRRAVEVYRRMPAAACPTGGGEAAPLGAAAPSSPPARARTGPVPARRRPGFVAAGPEARLEPPASQQSDAHPGTIGCLTAAAATPILAGTARSAASLPRRRAPDDYRHREEPLPMSATPHDFLHRLLAATGPAGFESAAAEVWRAEAASRGLEVSYDLAGNSIARLPGAGPRVAVVGHIDELGLMITHIDADGFLWFRPIGGWDEQVLVGQRVRILARSGEVIGLIGRRPTHLMESDERERGARARDLWLDIGARDGAEAKQRVRVGDPAVLDLAPVTLPNNRLAGRAVDDRVGAFVALDVLRLLQAQPPAADVYAVASVQEEIGLKGAYTSAFRLMPVVAIAVDVTFATDVPSADKRGEGDHALGSGPSIARGSSVNPVVFERLVAAAEAADIPYTIEANPRSTGTDADAIARSGPGVACGFIGIPSRYMHTPNETVCLDDLDRAARLIAAFIGAIGPDTDFRP